VNNTVLQKHFSTLFSPQDNFHPDFDLPLLLVVSWIGFYQYLCMLWYLDSEWGCGGFRGNSKHNIIGNSHHVYDQQSWAYPCMYPIISVNMASSDGTHKHCCVPQCLNDSRTTTGIHFHWLPKDKTTKKPELLRLVDILNHFSPNITCFIFSIFLCSLYNTCGYFWNNRIKSKIYCPSNPGQQNLGHYWKNFVYWNYHFFKTEYHQRCLVTK